MCADWKPTYAPQFLAFCSPGGYCEGQLKTKANQENYKPTADSRAGKKLGHSQPGSIVASASLGLGMATKAKLLTIFPRYIRYWQLGSFIATGVITHYRFPLILGNLILPHVKWLC